MNHKCTILVLTLAALLGTLAVGAVLAQTSPNYNLEWNILAGGGGLASSDNYIVQGTAGQALSGASQPSSDNFRVGGGFWGGGGGFEEVPDFDYTLYLPLLLKNSP